MIIFKSFENFCGFLFFSSVAAGAVCTVIWLIVSVIRKIIEIYRNVRKVDLKY